MGASAAGLGAVGHRQLVLPQDLAQAIAHARGGAGQEHPVPGEGQVLQVFGQLAQASLELARGLGQERHGGFGLPLGEGEGGAAGVLGQEAVLEPRAHHPAPAQRLQVLLDPGPLPVLDGIGPLGLQPHPQAGWHPVGQLAPGLVQQRVEQFLSGEMAVGGQPGPAEGQVVLGFGGERGAGGHGPEQGGAVAPVALEPGVQGDAGQGLAGAALAVGIEGAEPLQLVAEELQAQGPFQVVRPEVHHQAPGAELALAPGQVGAPVAQGHQRLQQQFPGHLRARAQLQLLLFEPGGVGQPLLGRQGAGHQHLHPVLQQADEGGQAVLEHHPRRAGFAAGEGGEAREQGHPGLGQEHRQVVGQGLGLRLGGGVHPEGALVAALAGPAGQDQGQGGGGGPAQPRPLSGHGPGGGVQQAQEVVQVGAVLGTHIFPV